MERAGCPVCGGRGESAKVTVRFFIQGHRLWVTNIPGYLCRDCGETWPMYSLGEIGWMIERRDLMARGEIHWGELQA